MHASSLTQELCLVTVNPNSQLVRDSSVHSSLLFKNPVRHRPATIHPIDNPTPPLISPLTHSLPLTHPAPLPAQVHTMSAQTIFRTGAGLTAAGMSFGAFGAHALKSRYPTLPESSHNSWMTGSSYLVYNGLALLALSAHPSVALGLKRYRTAFGLIVGGVAVFSGSIL